MKRVDFEIALKLKSEGAQALTQLTATVRDSARQASQSLEGVQAAMTGTSSVAGSSVGQVRNLTNAFADQEKAVINLSQTFRASGQGAKDFIPEDLAENIRVQKEVIKEYEKNLQNVKKLRQQKAGTGEEAQLIQDERNWIDAIGRERASLADLESQVVKTTTKQTSYRTQIMQLKEELQNWEMAGKRATDPAGYLALQKKLGDLNNAYKDVRQQATVMANDQRVYQGLIVGVSGITGAFSAAQGAMSLFAGENENLQKAMLKVQALMGITIGLQQLSQMLDKDSAFQLVIVTRAKNMLSVASLNLGRALMAQGMSANAARVALINLQLAASMGLALAVVALIALWNKYTERQEAAKKKAEEAAKVIAEQDERINSLAKSYAEEVSKVESIRAALHSEGLSRTQKLKLIKQMKDIIPDYTAKLGKEGSVIWENKKAIDAYMVSLEKSLKFKAAQEDLAKIYAEIYKIQTNQDKRVFEKDYKNKKEFQDEYMVKVGLNPSDHIDAMMQRTIDIQWNNYENQVKVRNARLQELYAKAAGIKDYVSTNNLVALDTPGKSGNTTDPFVEALEKKKKEYERYLQWKNSTDATVQKSTPTEFKKLLEGGDDYMAYLVRQRSLLQDNKSLTAGQRSELVKLNNAIAEEGGQMFLDPATIEELDTTISYLEKKLSTASESERAGIQESINGYKKKKKAIEETLSDLSVNFANPQTIEELETVIGRLEERQKQAGEAERADLEKTISGYRRKKTAMEEALVLSGLDSEVGKIQGISSDMELRLNIKLAGYEYAVAKIEQLRRLLSVTKDPKERAEINKSIEGWEKYSSAVYQAKTKGEMAQGAIQDTASIMGNLSGVVGKGASGWLQYGANVLSAVSQALPVLAKLIGGNIAQAFSGAIAQSQTLPPPFNLIQMGASLAAVAAAVASIPEYADGGIAYGRTLGVFGEYSGAQNNPEVVAPLDRLRSLIQPSGGAGGTVEFRIEGRTLVGMLNKMNKINSRA